MSNKMPANEDVSTCDLLEASLWVIELLSKNLKGPVEPHPYGLCVIDIKQRLRKAISTCKKESK